MSPGEKLKHIRYILDLTQKEISEMLSMTQSAWCNCENDIRMLSVKRCYMLIKLAKIKGVDLELDYLRPF